MKINKNAELQVLLQYGWINSSTENNIYFKGFYQDYGNCVSLIINPNGFDSDFCISTVFEDYSDYEEIAADMYEILEEIELLKKLKILI